MYRHTFDLSVLKHAQLIIIEGVRISEKIVRDFVFSGPVFFNRVNGSPPGDGKLCWGEPIKRDE